MTSTTRWGDWDAPAHDLLVLVGHKLGELLAEGRDARLRLLHQHQRHRHQRALPHEVHRVRLRGPAGSLGNQARESIQCQQRKQLPSLTSKSS